MRKQAITDYKGQSMAGKITLSGLIAEIRRINRKAKIERLVKEIPGLTYQQALNITK